MATAAQPADKTPAKSTPKGAGPDAIALLKADHREAEGLFGQIEKASAAKKTPIVEKLCGALRVHMQIEEEIFYPAARDVLKKEDMVDEAVVEHAAARTLMDELQAMQPGDDLYDAKVKVLREQIDHHVEEEEKEMFPALQKTDMDMKAIGARMSARKDELTAQMTAKRQ